MIKTNYHTHTLYCDGKNSPEEVILSAIEKKFDILGFSGHSMYPFAEYWHISPKQINDYMAEIKTLAEKYKDHISILCGFEADYIPGITEPTFSNYEIFNPDFLIGSVHYIATPKGIMAVDGKPEDIKKGIDKLFNKNAKKAVCEYFYLQREMIKKCDFTILGHPDLFRKENERLNLFNESDSWYKKEVKALAKEIAKKGIITEVNTGAITRKKMNDVYPSAFFLNLLKEYNVPVTISSDAHSANDLDGTFETAIDTIKKAGYSEVAYLNSSCKIQFQKI